MGLPMASKLDITQQYRYKQPNRATHLPVDHPEVITEYLQQEIKVRPLLHW